MRLKLQQLLHGEFGAAAIEIGLIGAGFCVALITLAGQMDGDVKVVFERIGDLLRSLNMHALT